jgi:hypothetical protein
MLLAGEHNGRLSAAFRLTSTISYSEKARFDSDYASFPGGRSHP